VDESAFSHAQILAGKALVDDKSITTHFTSNLVRAIDTLFFSVFPSLQDGSITEVLATSYAQEVGGGWDGSVHRSRMRNCIFTTDTNVDRAVCIKARHNRQIESLRNLIDSKRTQGESAFVPLLAAQAEFYEGALTPKPSYDTAYWKYQMENAHEKRKSASVQLHMFKDLIAMIAATTTDYFVIAGHSHYFAHFVSTHSAKEDDRCKTFGEAMQDNGAVWRVKLDTKTGLISHCTIVYGKFKRALLGLVLNPKVTQYEKDDMGLEENLLESRMQQLEEDLMKLNLA